MTRIPPDLPDLLGSRICHDLVSPLGAIANGVELLQLSGSSGAELELIAESVANATARLRFFRVAFGGAVPGQPLAGREIAAILGGVSDGARVRLDWPAPPDLERAEARALFLLLQCAAASLPEGGRVTVAPVPDGWQLAPEGPRIAADPGLFAALCGEGPAEAMPAEVEFLLAPRAAASAGRRIRVETDPLRLALLA